MQGPVGFRCRDCGRPVRDPMSSFTPVQLWGGVAVSFGGGLLTAAISAQFGFFALFVALFAGGLVAQAITRVTGYKMGGVMDLLVYGGIAAGALAAFGLMNADAIKVLLTYGAGSESQTGVGNYLANRAFWAAIAAVVTCVGARSRLG